MQIVFTKKVPAGGGATSFIFTPSEPLIWIAGQAVRLEIPGVYGPEEHPFTISAAPYRQQIEITTRPSESTYKQALFSMVPGTLAQAYDIRGDFTWGEGTMPRVFVASGIGVTPFVAILGQRQHESQPLSATLLYAFRKGEGVFIERLQQLHAAHPELHLHLLEASRMSAELINVHVPNLAANMVYLAGPTVMVDDIANALSQKYRIPDAQLKKDWFTGRLGPE
ncbi:MAG TPA: FAD-dependent oxidoreductase [Candidatus Saccharimonadales bacterium]|nr:FAD-dependent oxidoreductase [Candidatus Saccharimonadales bacterium]